MRAVIGALLAGQTYEDYREETVARGMQFIHDTTFDRYLLLPCGLRRLQ